MLKISLSFLKSLTGLPSERMKKIPKFVQILHGNPSLPSLHLEHLATVDLYSARIDDGYRAILERRGTNYMLLFAGKHDDAYRWAERYIGSSQSAEFPLEDYVPAGVETPRAEQISPEEELKIFTTTTETYPAVEALRVGSIYTWINSGSALRGMRTNAATTSRSGTAASSALAFAPN